MKIMHIKAIWYANNYTRFFDCKSFKVMSHAGEFITIALDDGYTFVCNQIEVDILTQF